MGDCQASQAQCLSLWDWLDTFPGSGYHRSHHSAYGGYNKEASAHASDSEMNMFQGFK
jgi:hypothetical protein